MQVSTNLPSGAAIEKHLASGETLQMNVSKEADAALMRELQDGDPIRFARLHKNMLKGRAVKSGWVVGRCVRCQENIHNTPFLSASEPGEFCSHDCRDKCRRGTKTRRSRHFTDCPGCGRKFLARRANNSTCSARCRQKACRKPETVGVSQIRENGPASPLITQDLQA